jgi:hypothetical protein
MLEYNKKFSAYPMYAGTVQSWLAMDTKELFAKNGLIGKTRNQLEKYGWLDKSFDYKFNTQGFRSDEFSLDSTGIVFLGCSFTAGIGLPYKNTFAKIVADEMKLRCYNLGLGAGSYDCCFRFASYWLDRLKPQVVCIFEPPANRTEVFVYNRLYQFYPEIFSDNKIEKFRLKDNSDVRKFYKIWLDDELNDQLNREKNLLAIEQLCNKLHIKFVNLHSGDIEYVDYARDLSHPGIKTNQQIALKFLDRIN